MNWFKLISSYLFSCFFFYHNLSILYPLAFFKCLLCYKMKNLMLTDVHFGDCFLLISALKLYPKIIGFSFLINGPHKLLMSMLSLLIKLSENNKCTDSFSLLIFLWPLAIVFAFINIFYARSRQGTSEKSRRTTQKDKKIHLNQHMCNDLFLLFSLMIKILIIFTAYTCLSRHQCCFQWN